MENYKYSQNLTLSNIEYINVREIPKNLTDAMEYSDHFNQEVNLNESGVHIPIEIYQGCKFTLLFKFAFLRKITIYFFFRSCT